jgi:hypothetical protein
MVDVDEPDVQQVFDGSDPVGEQRATVRLTVDQRYILDQAIEKMREHADDPALSEGRCLELIAVDFLESFNFSEDEEEEDEDADA